MEVRTRLVAMLAGVAACLSWYFLLTAATLPQWTVLAIPAGGAFGTVLVLVEEADLGGPLDFGLSVVTGLIPSIAFSSYSSESLAIFLMVAVMVLFATEVSDAIEEDVFAELRG